MIEISIRLGYLDGWRLTCKEMGLTVGADSGCELSMDRVLLNSIVISLVITL